MGKSASRFPFITLLMSFGTESVTTNKVGEQIYVFKRKKKKVRTGTTTISMDSGNRTLPNCYTPSYLYTYDVYSHMKPEPVEPDAKKKENEKAYNAQAASLPVCKPLPADWTHLGDVSVPSVDHFPYFLRLLVDNQTETLEAQRTLEVDMNILQESTVARGSWLAPESVLPNSPIKEEEEDEEEKKHAEEEDEEEEHREEEPTIGIYVNETRILPKGAMIKENSVLAKGSSLCTLAVVNRLENTKWHVVDDLTFCADSKLESDSSYVLFTSPKGSRWENVDQSEKTNDCLIVEYVVPKYTPQEQAALLNTIGARAITSENVNQALKGVQLFSFIPRFVLNPKRTKKAIAKLWKSPNELTEIEPKLLFSDKVSHKIIHFSCPQYDCHNWHTEFATELARWIALKSFNHATYKEYIKTLESMSPSAEFNQQRGAIFHAFVSDAILGGFHLTSAKKRLTAKKLSDCEPIPAGIQLPQPIGESFVFLRNSESMRKASLPDIKKIPVEKLKNFKQKWEILFSSPMLSHDVSSATLIIEDDNVTKDSRTIIKHGYARKQKRRARNEPAAKCFTFYLKPLGGNNAGFDSVLLFFKVHEQDGLEIDDLCVMFIQSTLAKEHPISDTGANLMFLWLALLCAVYGLNQQHIHPFFFFVKHPAVEKFRLKGDYTAASFIPRENVWVMDGHARKLKEVTLARTGRLILSSAAALEPNTNPAHFRCYFCDRIFTEFFPSHYCQNVAQKYEEALETNEQEMLPEDEGIFLEQSSLTGRERRNDFDPSFEFNLISTRPLDLGVGSNEKWRELKGIKLTYPHPSKPIPKSSVSLEAFDMMDVVMVGVEEQTESPDCVSRTPNEQEQAKPKFEVSHTRPIPSVFTYFPQRPDDSQPSKGIVEKCEDVAFKNKKVKTVVSNEFKNTTSRLLMSVRLISVWAQKMRIGFVGNMEGDVLSMGAQHRPHENLSALWEKTEIPLAQIHLPMNVFPKQTLLLGTRQILTPFEIRGTLSLVDTKRRKDRPAKIVELIDNGQALTKADSKHILSDKRALSLLPESDLMLLQTRIPTLRSLDMYELQSLVSFVSGTLTLISDILRTCGCLLESQDESSDESEDESSNESEESSDESEESSDESEESSDESKDATSTVLTGDGTAITDSMVSHQVEPRQLNEMKKCLKTSLSVASRHLKHVLEHKLLGTRTNVSDADVKIVVEGMKTNPLLPWWCRRHIIPFVTVVPDDCKKLVKRLTKKDKKLKRKDREICITVLLIHAPIEESEKKRLIALINKHFQETDQRTLTSLINQNSLSQKGVNKWNNALTCLEEIETLDSPEKKKALDELPRSVLIDYLQKPRGMRGDKSTILPLIEQAQLPEKDKDTLLSLVDGKPRFTFSRRKEIATLCCPTFPSESEDSLVKTIGVSKLDETNKKILKNYVTARESADDDEIKRLMKLIKKDKVLKQKPEDLSTFLDRSKIVCESDRSLVRLCCFAQLFNTKDDLDDLFNLLHKRSSDKELNECTSSNASKEPSSRGKIWRLFFVFRMEANPLLCPDWMSCFHHPLPN
ncbi:hypothetical protein BLNAU_22432 [Blattamonas nauphoetae]|uniref:Uncharacterized protein n=1 Tax=Blattamonas nauphoetae TaxID=2049346 RepID=A0ABQ9WTJ8_9EUKA|nr:hypothetical protein BLNAU_22432 [Blattamonas nauphoetae]